ncbi:MAG TPA: DinB family protein [Nocardioides sp.]
MSVEAEAGRDHLRRFVDAQRRSVLAIVDGLTDDQLREPVLPSGWTPVGMVLHLAVMERFWFQRVMTGRSSRFPWPDDRGGDERVEPFTTGHPAADVLDFYREQGRIADRVMAETPLSTPPALTDLPPALAVLATNLHTIALHVLEETARHAGHLDAARELLDGRTGLGPR